MNKKILIQLFLFLLFLFITVFSYYKFYKKDPEISQKVDTKKNLPTKKLKTNLISDLRYFSVDDEGNKYEIQSEYGEMGSVDPNIIFMTNVTAQIDVYNSEPIIITANFAKYNVKNYDTNFESNVLLKHVDNKVNGENLDLLFKDNVMSMYNNIVFQNTDTTLLADKLEIDLITKDSKITMNEKKSKIKIIKEK